MKLTKIIHSTLLLEYKDSRILFDPGNYLTPELVAEYCNDIDLILITHSHGDHLDLEILKEVIQLNKNVEIISNSQVAAILEEQDIKATICEKSNSTKFDGITIKSFELPHEEIWQDVELPQNTGYLLDNAFFNPADSFKTVDIEPEVAVFMIAGPAVTIGDALKYGVNQKMKLGIGVHDGMLNRTGANHILTEKFLPDYNKQYKNLGNGESIRIEVER